MEIENKVARLARNTGPARFFIPVGIILIAFGIFMLMFFKSGNFKEAPGKVTSVTEVGYETTQENHSEMQYDVGVSYKVDGKEYAGVFPSMTGKFTVGQDIKVFYDPQDPEKITNAKIPDFIWLIVIAAGVLAVIFGIAKTVSSFKKSKELDKITPGEGMPKVDFDAFKSSQSVTEYYCRFDGHTLKPGYILEDANRKVLFEGKMEKNSLVGARTFEFVNHTNGSTLQHEVGHVVSQTYNDGFFTMKSWFKFDGENIWELLHERGLRISTNMHSKFPNLIYDVSRDGEAFARIETSGQYVHEDEAEQHKLNIPVGRYYYRIWTDANDFETLFLTVFAISESEQVVVE
ncbi:MAG: DUF3592 domain-containing protein [Firmicutes bacterium]|nr:DUF3592 domain-containing protein [Bacillota bacterium]